MENKKPQSIQINQKKEASDPFAGIEIPPEQMEEVIAGATAGTLVGAVISNIPIIRELREWSERIDEGVKEEKLQILLRQYNDRFSSQKETLEKLKYLTATSAGKVLLSKVIHLLDRAIDEESISLLATVLENMTNSEVEKQFEQHSYVLSQIDRLTPQALIVLSRYETWKSCSLSGSSTTSKHTVLGDWDYQAATFLATQLKITASDVHLRLAHSFQELESLGTIVLDGSTIALEPIGKEIYGYITPSS